ncbi:MAG: hypothetical protein AAF662_15770 [Pseudomonadota bacterium]
MEDPQSFLEQMHSFEQLHIDVARNSTDDFNPFHDPMRWGNIVGNPFGGPIALGFQLEFLCADRIMRYRQNELAAEQSAAVEAGESQHQSTATGSTYPFRNFEFNFVGAVRPKERFAVNVRKTNRSSDPLRGLSNRVLIKKDHGGPVLIGTQSDTVEPRVKTDLSSLRGQDVRKLPDRDTVPGCDLFLKRKFLTTSNAKNFALAALCAQQHYIDELDEQVYFAPIFTASLLSCALLERGLSGGHDFRAEPMVYTSHLISVDIEVQRRLRSNDAVQLLVAPPVQIDPDGGLGKANVQQVEFSCAAMVLEGVPLFHALLRLAPLASLVERS